MNKYLKIVFIIFISILQFSNVSADIITSMVLPFTAVKLSDVMIKNNKLSYSCNVPILYRENNLYGYKDINGNIIIEAQYVAARSFSNGMAAVCKDRNLGFGYIDVNGSLVIDYKYFYCSDFENDIALVSYKMPKEKRDGTKTILYGDGNIEYYFIDKRGSNIFSRTYNYAEQFSDGYALVLVQGYIQPVNNPFLEKKYAYINLSGELVNNITYDEATSFKNGYANVIRGGIKGVIDTDFMFTMNN